MLSQLALLIILTLFVSIESYSKAAWHDHDLAEGKDSRSILNPWITATPFFPILGFHVEDKTANDSRFKREIGSHYALGILRNANENVAAILKRNSVRRVYGLVKLTIESFGGGREAPIVSTVTGKHIRVDSDYLETFSGDVKFEFNGIVHYGSARIWQWTGRNKAPIWLLTGVADYVRLKAGWPSVTWPGRGSGSGITDGYAVTAYFLEYCSVLRKGFVAELNSLMKESYSDDYSMKLLGKSIGELWGEYKKVYEMETSPQPRGSLPGKGQYIVKM